MKLRSLCSVLLCFFTLISFAPVNANALTKAKDTTYVYFTDIENENDILATH